MTTATLNISDTAEPTTGTGARPRKRLDVMRLTLIALGIAAAAAAGVYGKHWYEVGRYIESTDNAYLRADQVSMAPRVSGQVAEIYVGDNQDVAVGQPLVKIDPRRYEVAVRQAKATVDARVADVAKSEADLKQQDAVIAQAEADLDNAKANADLAKKDSERSASLTAVGAVSKEKGEQSTSALVQAKAVAALKQAALDAARQQVATLKAQVALAEAQLAGAQESLSQAQIDLNDTVLKSPIAGRVGDRTVQLGQFAQPGTRLLTIVPTDRVYLVANFKETQITHMRQGQPATISIDAYPGVGLKGTVDSFSPGTGAQFALLPPENATGNFTKIVQRVPVRIRLDAQQPSLPLVPGLSIEVAVDTRSEKTRTASIAP